MTAWAADMFLDGIDEGELFGVIMTPRRWISIGAGPVEIRWIAGADVLLWVGKFEDMTAEGAAPLLPLERVLGGVIYQAKPCWALPIGAPAEITWRRRPDLMPRDPRH